MQVTGDWLTAPTSQAVCHMLEAAGHEAYFVGGCVRNALIGAPVSDIDISTDARPETVTALAKKAGFAAVPTGIDHGTVTVVAGGVPHEVTTFRKDVETDGRRAVVAFSDCLEEDARRRDFTMNALYADARGAVTDPVGGLPDLRDRRVRFIDDASQRIREDYLRTLRFFRFMAWYGDPQGGYDPDALDAIASNLDGLESLSRERVGAEMLKLLSASDPVSALSVMRTTGVLACVLPGADDTCIGPLVFLEEQVGTKPDAVLRLAALGGADIPEALRLSRADARKLAMLRQEIGSNMPPAELGYRYGAELAEQMLLLRWAIFEQAIVPNDIAAAVNASLKDFPVGAKDLMPAYQGPDIGKRLRYLEKLWIDSGFTLSRDALLAHD